MSENKNNGAGSAVDGTIDESGSELIIDLLGPIVDISKIQDFEKVRDVRYRRKDEIVEILKMSGEKGWNTESVAKLIMTYLEPSYHVSILDMEVLRLLVIAKKYAHIKIISSVKNDDLFKKAKGTVIEYSKELCKHLIRKKKDMETAYESDDLIDFEELADDDFVQIGEDQNGNYREKKTVNDIITGGKNRYRIIFSEEKDKLSDEGLVREWIRGVSDDKCIQKLGEKVDKMKQIARAGDDLRKLLCRNKNKISIKEYSGHDNFEFYVFEERVRNGLASRITEIERILDAEKNAKRGNEPICVFLAGAPGTGKSYFVKLLTKYLRHDEECLNASLSGVPGRRFAKVIKRHIEAVYAECKKEDKKNIVAFLDEVDTDGGGETYAYRFLMDAMTGHVTNKEGNLVKDAEVRKLVWLFAGSAKITREEFINEFCDHERKVADFFDRIHFYLLLPSVQSSGQAILTFLSALDRPEGKNRIKVKKSVLYLFGRTVWKSARQIKTVCRIASARRRFSWEDAIDMDCFDEIDVLMEFVTTHKIVKLMEQNDQELREVIIVEFPVTSQEQPKKT